MSDAMEHHSAAAAFPAAPPEARIRAGRPESRQQGVGENGLGSRRDQGIGRERAQGPGQMITVFGEGRGFRIVWLLEEMALPYRLRPVDFPGHVEQDADFLSVNPAGFIPAISDGEVTMVESIAILQYIMGRYGPTALAPGQADGDFPAYLQFLHLGEAGLALPMYFAATIPNPHSQFGGPGWGAGVALDMFENRLGLVRRQLARCPYMAGARFTAADISVAYALEFAERAAGFALGKDEQAYLARVRRRPAYERAMATCLATKAWADAIGSE